MQFSDSILIRVETQPGLYNSGLGHLFWDDFNMPFVIGGTYIYSLICSLFSVLASMSSENTGGSCCWSSLENRPAVVA
jgi:hypothetical protein